ncbi:MAG: hypothetical protein JPMHGGIA_01707 [Saprospiraceae bacterium]|jgi:predicted DNA-binding transcriptional regulator AlpA|nr:hypothetical protein [Saprospiraceae bacterium]
MNEITFNELPKAVAELYKEVVIIKQLLSDRDKATLTEQDKWFDLKELCAYLPDKPSKLTVYGWVHNQSIPHRKGAKKLRFLKSEIDTWLKCGKKVSIIPDHETTPEYLLKAKGGRK